MIELIDIGNEKTVAYRLGGKITEEEMRLVLSEMKEKIEKYGEVSIYQEMERIPGVEFDAILEKMKFFSGIDLSNISRVAVVTHKKWMHKIIDLEGKLFKKFEMKGFALSDKDKAIEFLNKE
jgi:hypothetical protein